MPLVVGLTGGIGSGKSAAAAMFAELGAAIVDTDAIAHALTSPKGTAMAAIREGFGPDYLTPDGALDRARMRTRVFSDAAAKRRLEAILHPLIRAEVLARARSVTAPYVIVVIPLLFETGGYPGLIQRVAVVDCAEETQIARTMARSGLTRPEVDAILGTQASRGTRRAGAHDLLDNDGSLDDLRTQVAALHRLYLDLARRQTSTPTQ
jgi:dephospho-CoA kinase